MIKPAISFVVALSLLVPVGPVAASELAAQSGAALEAGEQVPSARTVATEGAPWSRKLPAAQRFEVVLDGEAVLDKETGLVWVRSPAVAKHSWADGQGACRWAETGGRLGWRLPRAEELASLVDPTVAGTPKIPTGHPFLNVRPASYWSADSLETDGKFAWMLGFDEGKANAYEKTKEMYVWCVRGGR